MKRNIPFLLCLLCLTAGVRAAGTVIRISTDNVDLIYKVGNNGRLYQSYLGKHLNHATDIAHLPMGQEAYITHGMEDYFELTSPYGSNHTSTMYVGKDNSRAVVFAFDMYPRYAEKTLPVRLQGLDANKLYRVQEINLMPGARSSLPENGKLFSGEYLMTVGISLFTAQQLHSRMVECCVDNDYFMRLP
jgi:hypothetical protein